MKNSTSTWLFVAFNSLLLISLGFMLLDRQGLLWGFALAVGIHSSVYFYSDLRILRLFKGRLLEGQDPWSIIYNTKKLSQRAKIPIPKVYIIKSLSPQAFSVGRNLHVSRIVLTEGVLSHFSEEEIKAILAYQIATIKNNDTLAFTTSGVLVGFLLSLTANLDRAYRWLFVIKRKDLGFKSYLFTWLLSPIISLLLKIHVHSRNYFEIDRLAAELLQKPEDLARVIWKLESFKSTMPFKAPISMSHMLMTSAFQPKGWLKHFITHPPQSKRIKKLVGYFPI